jgi:hypothetical protein
MGIWFRDIRTKPGESIIWRGRCNWLQGAAARGGSTAFTSQRVLFEPNRMDGLLGAHSRDISLGEIDSVTIDAAIKNVRSPLSGGLRRRIRIHLANGTHEVFLVSDAERRREQLEELVDRAKRSPDLS